MIPVVQAAPGDRPSLAGLRAGELHLWCAAPDLAADPGPLEALLADEELARTRALVHPPRRAEQLLTRALVRAVLSVYAPHAPRDWRFRTGSHGRPELEPPSPLRFNLSHCDGLVACLVGLEREVGVDVEPAGQGADALALAEGICSAAERRALAELPGAAAREAQALTLWTLKEAYVKARGLGLSLPVASLTFTLAADRISLVDPADAEPAPERWRFAAFALGPHRAALAAGPGPDGCPPARLVLCDAAALGFPQQFVAPGGAMSHRQAAGPQRSG